MVLSDAVAVVDDLVKASAAAKASAEKQSEQENDEKAEIKPQEEEEEKDSKSPEDQSETIMLTVEGPETVVEALQQVELGEIPTQDVHEAASSTGLTEIPLAVVSSTKDEVETLPATGKIDLEDVPADVDIAEEGLGSIGFEEEAVSVTINEEEEDNGVAVPSEEGKDKIKLDEDNENAVTTVEGATSQRPDSPV
jgi:hypothetical protein